MRGFKPMEEEFIEITPELEDKIMCDFNFICAGSTKYRSKVNSKIMDGEIGCMYKNNKRIRYIVSYIEKDLVSRRREKARFFLDKFDYFIPYWAYDNINVDEKEVGRMVGCKIIL